MDNSTNRFGNEVTYVIGHKSPDSDAICASIAYANLKQSLRVKCEARANGTINRETAFILKYFNVPVPEILSDAKDKQIIIVDHQSYSVSTDGMREAKIVEVIDHHNIDDLKTNQPIFYLAMPIGSTNTIVYSKYIECGVKISREMAGIMLGAILSDTDNLTSQMTTEMDRYVVKDLAKIAKINDTDTFYAQMQEALFDRSGMTTTEIAHSDYREYKFGETFVGIGMIFCRYDQDSSEIIARLKNELAEIRMAQKKPVDIALMFVKDIKHNIVMIVFDGENAAEILNRAFDVAISSDGVAVMKTPVTSRKRKIVPALSKVIAN